MSPPININERLIFIRYETGKQRQAVRTQP